jgi:AraC family transcriptional regulator
MHAEWRTGSKRSSRRELSGNIVSIIPAGQPHRTLWQRRASLIHVYLSVDFLSSTAARILHRDAFKVRPAYLVRDPFVEELGRSLYRECKSGTLCKVFASSLATLLATHLARTYNARTDQAVAIHGGLAAARERRIREHIEHNLDQDLSLERLAEVVGLSASHFATLFRQSTGFTPHQYVSHRRIERAQQLLTETTEALVEVASACGFTSQSQFTTLFRRFTGVTPGKFRQARALHPL